MQHVVVFGELNENEIICIKLKCIKLDINRYHENCMNATALRIGDKEEYVCPMCKTDVILLPHGPTNRLINTCSIDGPLFIFTCYMQNTSRRGVLLQKIGTEGPELELKNAITQLADGNFLG